MHDWTRFIEWYTGRQVRLTGSPPAKTTLKNKRSCLNTAARLSGAESPEQLAVLVGSRPAMEGLLDALFASLTPGSVQLVAQAVSNYGEFSKARGLIAEVCIHPGQDAPGRNRRKIIEVYTPQEVELLLGASRGVSLRFWAYLSTVALTGRRASEVLALRWDGLHLDGRPAHFTLPTSKTGKPQFVPLSDRLCAEVFTTQTVQQLRSGPNKYARDVSTHPFPWNYSTPHASFEALCRRTGTHNLGFHGFRHTFATRHLAKGTPPQAVAALLGHSLQTLMTTYDQTTALAYARYLED